MRVVSSVSGTSRERLSGGFWGGCEMTDARIPDQWLGDPRFDNWQPETWKFFIDCLMWSNRYLTDGQIPIKHARALALDSDLDLLVSQVEGAEMCTRTRHAIHIDWSNQSTRKEIEARKEANRIKQQNFRDKKRTEIYEVRSNEAGNVTGYIPGDVGQDRLGQDDTF
jgi:hypothetical protein